VQAFHAEQLLNFSILLPYLLNFGTGVLLNLKLNGRKIILSNSALNENVFIRLV